MANIKELIQSIESPDSSFDEKLAVINEMQDTLVAMKEHEQEAIDDNVELIIEALRTIEAKVEAKLRIIPEKGEQGIQGSKGEQGDRGLDGAQGKDGKSGVDGKDGLDGKDGVSVQDAKIDFDGSLIITLSDGREINVGEVVPVDVAQTIHKIQSGSGGDSQTTLNAIAALQATIATYGTMATQNKTSVDIEGGTIDNTTIGATTPAAGTFTTITGQTATINGTGQNLVANSQTIGGTGWGNIGTTTATINTAVAPDSTTTASTITGASNIAYNTNNTVYAVTVTPSTLYTFSCYVKFGTATTVSIGFRDNSTGADISVANTTASNWTRISVSYTSGASTTSANLVLGGANGTFFAWGAQANTGATATAYVATAGAITLGNPYITIGTALIGVTSTGALYVQPAGTGALQAQATTSTAAGGNARGANAVDWQMARTTASKVASGNYSVVGGGYDNVSSGTGNVVLAGYSNSAIGSYTSVSGGRSNTAGGGDHASIVGGLSNTGAGYFNFIGGGFTNSGTSASAVTTQSGTMNATTAVTLSGSNANIKVGQLIIGTSIASYTYVAAISGTSLTLSQAASGSSTSTLSFYTPHGVVVGGGNNQATGSYSFIGGGGDAGTAANRNVASGDWSVVGGGQKNTASGLYSFVGGGTPNTASGSYSGIASGSSNTATGAGGFIGAGVSNVVNGTYSAIMGGYQGTTRGIGGYHAFPATINPLGFTVGACQSGLLIIARETTDATATRLTSDATTSGGTTNQVILPNNSAYYFRGEVVSGVTGGGNTKGWFIEGVIKRGANAASTALVGTPTVTSNYADAGASTWTIAVTADTTNGGLAVTFTGQAATTIRTVAQIRTTEMTY